MKIIIFNLSPFNSSFSSNSFNNFLFNNSPFNNEFFINNLFNSSNDDGDLLSFLLRDDLSFIINNLFLNDFFNNLLRILSIDWINDNRSFLSRNSSLLSDLFN